MIRKLKLNLSMIIRTKRILMHGTFVDIFTVIPPLTHKLVYQL